MQSCQRHSVELYAQTQIPLVAGVFNLSVYRSLEDQVEHVVLSQGTFEENRPPFLRIHSECYTGEVLNSLRCDCKSQLDSALENIAREAYGLVIYLRNHEGRGIGLGNKIRAYALQQNAHLDTIKANHALGFAEDLRNFSVAIAILKELGIDKVRLNTNNPKKIEALEAAGILISERVPSLSTPNPHNDLYLRTKYCKLGHHLEPLFGVHPEGPVS